MTVGEYVEAVRAKSLFSSKTLQSYAQALRKIAGDIAGEAEPRKARCHQTAHPHPREGRSLADRFRPQRGYRPLAGKSARISVRSFIHRARSLFTAGAVARIRDLVEIPERLPFSGIKVETVYGPRYRATFNMVELLESARQELAGGSPTVEDLPSGRDGRSTPQRNRCPALDAFRWGETRSVSRPPTLPAKHTIRRATSAWTLNSWSFSADTMHGGKAILSSRATRRRRPSMHPMGIIAT